MFSWLLCDLILKFSRFFLIVFGEELNLEGVDFIGCILHCFEQIHFLFSNLLDEVLPVVLDIALTESVAVPALCVAVQF